MATILLVEDDHALAMGTQYALEAEGYTVLHAPDLAEARRLMNTGEENIDLILLDVMLPDGNGYDYCREIRRDDPQVPIIFLTAVSEEVNIVQGLELGADDYVAKPYRVKELLSRIAANLRRVDIMKRSGNGMRISFGGHELDVDDFRLYYHEQIVDITPGEFRLLKELVLHDGMVLTRNHLLEQLYDTGESFVDDNTLSVYIKRLRDTLEEDSEWIETVRGVGYRFRKINQ